MRNPQAKSLEGIRDASICAANEQDQQSCSVTERGSLFSSYFFLMGHPAASNCFSHSFSSLLHLFNQAFRCAFSWSTGNRSAGVHAQRCRMCDFQAVPQTCGHQLSISDIGT